MGADGPVAVASIVSAAVTAAIAERWAGRGTLGQGVVPPRACLHGRHTKGYGGARVAKHPAEPRSAGLVVTGNEKEEHVCLPPLKPHRHPFCTSLPRRDGGRESTGRRVMGNGEPPPFWVTACRASASRQELTASAPRSPVRGTGLAAPADLRSLPSRWAGRFPVMGGGGLRRAPPFCQHKRGAASCAPPRGEAWCPPNPAPPVTEMCS